MKLGQLSLRDVRQRLRQPGIALRCGPFCYRIYSRFESVARGLSRLYADHELVDAGAFVDFEVRVDAGRGLRRVIRPQARFLFDGESPFEPLPRAQAWPLLEWGMNWCITALCTDYLILHAAVVERGGRAVILPAPPGSGKSTLCATLVASGWRLLSDELALISPVDASLSPLCRPISLKNESIELIHRFDPDAVFGDVTPGTVKGAVGHMKVRLSDQLRIDETAMPGWIVFPKYVEGAAPALVRRTKGSSLMELGRNAFNYNALGRQGFETLSAVVDRSDCFGFEYSRLDDAVRIFDALSDGC